jgi:hypothetical protein
MPAPAVAPEAGKGVYLDDRSTPERLITSFVNALNRKEYARAYSYWESTPQLRPYDQFVSGYAHTQAVQVSPGSATSTAGGGQIFFALPAIMHATNDDGSKQTFVGCYFMHLANPGIQGPPYKPLAIMTAAVQLAKNDTDANALLQQVCQQR